MNNKNTAHDNRDLNAHKSADFSVDIDDNTWEGSQLEATSDPLIDSNQGKPYVIRFFEYSINPQVEYTPSKQELFNHHYKQIRNDLWKDGLTAVESVSPRVLFSKDKKKYYIAVTAEPKLNVAILEKTQTLQQIINQKKVQ